MLNTPRSHGEAVLVAGRAPDLADGFPRGVRVVRDPAETFTMVAAFPGIGDEIFARLAEADALAFPVADFGAGLGRSDVRFGRADPDAVRTALDELRPTAEAAASLPAGTGGTGDPGLAILAAAHVRDGRIEPCTDPSVPEMVSFPLLKGIPEAGRVLSRLLRAGLIEVAELFERTRGCGGCGSARVIVRGETGDDEDASPGLRGRERSEEAPGGGALLRCVDCGAVTPLREAVVADWHVHAVTGAGKRIVRAGRMPAIELGDVLAGPAHVSPRDLWMLASWSRRLRERYGNPFALVTAEVRGAGSAGGRERVLSALADAIGSSIRTCDAVAAFGDAAVILLPETDGEGARTVRERVEARARDVVAAGTDLRCTVREGDGAAAYVDELARMPA